MNLAETEIPFDWQIVKVDQTSMCGADWLAENNVAACGVFYVYDANRHVHICSFTPSQECFPVASYATPTKSDLTEKESEALSEVETEILNSEEPVCYMDVSAVARLPHKSVGKVSEREEDEDRETYYDRVCEELREYYAGIPPWF